MFLLVSPAFTLDLTNLLDVASLPDCSQPTDKPGETCKWKACPTTNPTAEELTTCKVVCSDADASNPAAFGITCGISNEPPKPKWVKTWDEYLQLPDCTNVNNLIPGATCKWALCKDFTQTNCELEECREADFVSGEDGYWDCGVDPDFMASRKKAGTPCYGAINENPGHTCYWEACFNNPAEAGEERACKQPCNEKDAMDYDKAGITCSLRTRDPNPVNTFRKLPACDGTKIPGVTCRWPLCSKDSDPATCSANACSLDQMKLHSTQATSCGAHAYYNYLNNVLPHMQQCTGSNTLDNKMVAG